MQKKEFLLNHLIKQYVKCQEPIGSESLKSCLQGKISSATIRNYFKILGQEGVLVQTHISSGRVPTRAALRNYWREMLQPACVEPEIDTTQLHSLCDEFGLTCALRLAKPQKLLRVLEIEAGENGAIVLVFEHDCVAIPFVASIARFCQELVGVAIDDMQRIAQDVCANTLAQALRSLQSAEKTRFFGLEFLGEMFAQAPQSALEIVNGDLFARVDCALHFPDSSDYLVIAHSAQALGQAAKMLCIGRLDRDYQGFYEALESKAS